MKSFMLQIGHIFYTSKRLEGYITTLKCLIIQMYTNNISTKPV